MIPFLPLFLRCAFCLALFVFGFAYGRMKGHEKALKDAILGYKQSQVIQNEVQNMDDYNVCLKLGGMPDECAELMHGLTRSAKDTPPASSR